MVLERLLAFAFLAISVDDFNVFFHYLPSMLWAREQSSAGLRKGQWVRGS